MNRTAIMELPLRNNARRYSHLEVLSDNNSYLRPRSCSTSMISVTETTPELRSVGGSRRAPPTPCTTPCFVSPRMAFTTQYSLDSPIQIITCSGGDLLRPVARWRSRCSLAALCSRKALLVIILLIMGGVYLFHPGGKNVASLPEGRCDAGDATHHCHDHGSSQFQEFLSGEQPTASPEREEDLETEEETDAERNNRRRTLTVRGEYENYKEENDTMDDYDYGNIEGKHEIEEAGEEKDGQSEDLTAMQQDATEDLSRERRDIAGDVDVAHNTDLDKHPNEVLTREPPSQSPQHDSDAELQRHTTRLPFQQHMREEQVPNSRERLDQLYMQHRNLGRNNYHSEQVVVEEEINREMLRHREMEEESRDQRFQPHQWQREEHQQFRQRWVGEQQHQREAGDPSTMDESHHGWSGGQDGRHPAWRSHDTHGHRLPRGVNPRRYYEHMNVGL